MSSRYLIKPRADQDVEDQALYFATEANEALGHRFLIAAHETFALLARQPGIGWHPRIKILALEAMRIFSVTGFPKILVLYRPIPDGVEILRVVHGSRDLLLWVRSEGID